MPLRSESMEKPPSLTKVKRNDAQLATARDLVAHLEETLSRQTTPEGTARVQARIDRAKNLTIYLVAKRNAALAAYR